MPHKQHLGKRVGRPQALEFLPEIFDLPGLARQPLFISIHDHLAISVEEAEMEHVIHGGHEDQILPTVGMPLTSFSEDINRRSHHPLIP